jgi:hypothetical protein
MYRALLIVLPLAIAGSSTAAPADDSLDKTARDYVRLQLAVGEKEDGYIDAYYGPEVLKTEGKALAQKSDLAQLKADAEALRSRAEKLGKGATPMNARRAHYLQAQLTAAITRLRMLQGEKLSFDEEAKGQFSVVPKLKPLSAYDAVLAKVDRLVPGKGPLSDRVDAFQDRFTIHKDRLRPVMEAAIAGCKAATVRYIMLPKGEHFGLAFVTGKSWSGYNYYQGDYVSRIEVNTDLPIRIDRAVDLGCHEGYPGHHVLNSLLEEKLTRGRGWVEFSVYPLFSPQSLIAEGTANYGIRLAFPGGQKVTFERAKLYPLAGLPPSEAQRYETLRLALKDLSGARMTIAREFLDGRISDQQAVDLTRKYTLVSEARAKQSVSFTKHYRTYVINYGLGEDMVAADVERNKSQPARWRRFEQIISEPTLPADLR